MLKIINKELPRTNNNYNLKLGGESYAKEKNDKENENLIK